MVKLAPSKNPQKESKQFATIALICGVLSLFIWFFGAAGLGAGMHGLILSRRVKSTRYTVFSIIGLVLSLIAVVYYYTSVR